MRFTGPTFGLLALVAHVGVQAAPLEERSPFAHARDVSLYNKRGGGNDIIINQIIKIQQKNQKKDKKKDNKRVDAYKKKNKNKNKNTEIVVINVIEIREDNNKDDKNKDDKDKAEKDKAEKDKAEKDKAEKEKAAKDKAAKDKAAKDKAAKDKAEKDKAEKDKAEKDKAMNGTMNDAMNNAMNNAMNGDAEKAKADKEKADKEKADKEKADKEKADKQKADMEKAQKDIAGKGNDTGVAAPEAQNVTAPQDVSAPQAAQTASATQAARKRLALRDDGNGTAPANGTLNIAQNNVVTTMYAMHTLMADVGAAENEKVQIFDYQTTTINKDDLAAATAAPPTATDAGANIMPGNGSPPSIADVRPDPANPAVTGL
ncbi:MAG: hypothetical protein M1813_003805 [Trichoglossum hirsutum]|nr:MAG: hypothetical protein M1813_003805 [Trichoglossum hirsutum]